MRRRLSVAEAREQLDDMIERVSADGEEVEIERDGAVIARIVPARNGETSATAERWPAPRLADPDDIWENYDPERMRRALRASAGVLAGIDVEAWKRQIREMRGQDSVGRPGDDDLPD